MVTLDIEIGPFLSFEIEIGDGPGPELDKNVICNSKKMLQLEKAILPLILNLCNSTEHF